MTVSTRPARRPFRLRFDPYLLVCVLMGVFLFHPLVRDGITQAPDAMVHFFRSVLWRWAWNDGVFWPRWHTLLYQGYGYTALSFNAPLLYFSTALISYITPTIQVAFKVVILAACILYPVGMYLWAKDVLGSRAAIVAAAAYAFATFRFRELYFLGGMAQYLSWSLFPLPFFLFRRLAPSPSRGYFLAATLVLTLQIMSHNIGAMLFTATFVPYLICLAIVYRKEGAWRRLVAAGLVGLALSAVFWLPALGEMAYTRVNVLTTGYWDVSVHMLRVKEFFKPSILLDNRAVLPPLPFNYGQLYLALALVGALAIFRHSTRPLYRFHLGFAIAGTLTWTLMMLKISLPVWRVVPFLEFAEYPFRVYGAAFLCSSLLVGASVAWLERSPRWQLVASSVAVAALILSVGVYFFPRPFIHVRETLKDYVTFEPSFRAVGTTAGDEFLPPGITQMPKEPAIRRDLTRIALLNPREGENGEITEVSPVSLKLRVSVPTTSTVTIAQFYFPGWHAQIDGREAPVGSTGKTGLIALTIPAGEHEVFLVFQDTPPRRIATALFWVGLVALVLIAWRIRSKPNDEVPHSPPDWIGAGVIGGMLVVMLLLKVLLIEPYTTWFRQTSPPGEALPATHRIDGDLGGKVTLLGYDMEPLTTRKGNEVFVRLYWQALQPLDVGYASFVELLAGPEQQAFARSDKDIPGYIPPVNWTREQYVQDPHYIPVPSDAPPVAYTVRAGLYDPKTMDRLGTVELPEKVHVLPGHPLRETQVKSEPAARFGEGIRLLGHHVEERDGGLDLTLYWQTSVPPVQDYQVFVHLLDDGGRMLGQNDGPPVNGYYAASAWLPDQIIADVHRVPVPAGSRPAAVAIGLYDLASGQRLPAANAGGERLKDDALVIPLAGEAAP
jgi:6-pyruvoyl-tetrahydropterin synthase related domain